MSLVYVIYCDGLGPIFADHACPRQIEGSQRMQGYQLRAAAKAQGWKIGRPGGEDLCPDCARRELGLLRPVFRPAAGKEGEGT